MAILVAGGAGYIGSHTVQELIDAGKEVVIVDSLEYGHQGAVLAKKFYKGNIGDKEFLKKVFRENDIEAVMHFCAYIEVGESVTNPRKYYNNNIVAGIALLDTMLEANVKRFVFSSTAAVYGQPEKVPISEDTPTLAVNPYGETKLSFEKILKWYGEAYGMTSSVLRYFNACGAHPNGHIGEDHSPESHLVPLILQVPLGKRASIKIFGDDYPTRDGSCVRDYIHVSDLALAHVLAVDRLIAGKPSITCNLGNGVGFSVKEIINTAREVTGHKIPADIVARRAGDPAELIAESDRARRELGWKPKYHDVKTIIATAWEWHRKHPSGYGDR
ncbi:MAG: UDP-glucose 4-epimerase GalE [Spirochaetes bacterium]|nr:UDP-glucose 4-epimerase GalE [Spirochaetota bacterium]